MYGFSFKSLFFIYHHINAGDMCACATAVTQLVTLIIELSNFSSALFKIYMIRYNVSDEKRVRFEMKRVFCFIRSILVLSWIIRLKSGSFSSISNKTDVIKLKKPAAALFLNSTPKLAHINIYRLYIALLIVSHTPETVEVFFFSKGLFFYSIS